MWFGKREELIGCKDIPSEDIKMILDFLKDNDMVALPCGRYELRGESFVNVFEYDTKVNDGVFEAHRKYTDVQFVITGKEIALWSDKYSSETEPYKPDSDCSFGTVDNATAKELNDKLCVVFLKGEPHKAGVSVDSVMKVKKAVFKLA